MALRPREWTIVCASCRRRNVGAGVRTGPLSQSSRTQRTSGATPRVPRAFVRLNRSETSKTVAQRAFEGVAVSRESTMAGRPIVHRVQIRLADGSMSWRVVPDEGGKGACPNCPRPWRSGGRCAGLMQPARITAGALFLIALVSSLEGDKDTPASVRVTTR